ncbi:zinc metalloproteinase nas-6-like [Cloeon dipterum]|uniref:zinc metalloproteinase nas-6-like n=1 Tax=Cloeon dipterum TaxID=197152 RepID=UPI00322061E1
MEVWFLLVTAFSLLRTLETASPSVDNSPPQIHHGWNYPPDHNEEEIRNKVHNWNENSGTNIWEHSGLKEGDIMEQAHTKGRNVVKSRKINWPHGIIPFILQPGMNSGEKKAVQRGMEWVMERSCIKFRPYRSGDKDYVHLMYNLTGCWGYVGRQGGGQVISLQRHACFIPGSVAHELLHATGFHHEQSAPNRDEYVFINYTNVEKGKKHQFQKYSSNVVTDYGVGYDYDSLMHYSRKAFSKNGQDTIIPYQPGVEIGQKSHISEKDYEKLNFKYCNKTVEEMEHEEHTTQSIRPTSGPRPGTVVKPDSSGPNNNRPGGNSNRPNGGSGGNRPGGNRPESSGGRPGSGGNRPENSGSRPGGNRPGSGGNRPENSGGRPGGNRPGSGGNRPENSGGRPGGNRPENNRPGNGGNRPGGNRPENSGGRPGGRPPPTRRPN